MSESGSTQSVPITPYLYYEDVSGALGWLSRVFGFEEQEKETMRDPEGRVVHAKMKLGNGVILMGSPGKDYICPKRLGHVTQNLSWSFLGAVSWRNFRGGPQAPDLSRAGSG